MSSRGANFCLLSHLTPIVSAERQSKLSKEREVGGLGRWGDLIWVGCELCKVEET